MADHKTPEVSAPPPVLDSAPPVEDLNRVLDYLLFVWAMLLEEPRATLKFMSLAYKHGEEYLEDKEIDLDLLSCAMAHKFSATVPPDHVAHMFLPKTDNTKAEEYTKVIELVNQHKSSFGYDWDCFVEHRLLGAALEPIVKDLERIAEDFGGLDSGPKALDSHTEHFLYAAGTVIPMFRAFNQFIYWSNSCKTVKDWLAQKPFGKPSELVYRDPLGDCHSVADCRAWLDRILPNPPGEITDRSGSHPSGHSSSSVGQGMTGPQETTSDDSLTLDDPERPCAIQYQHRHINEASFSLIGIVSECSSMGDSIRQEVAGGKYGKPVSFEVTTYHEYLTKTFGPTPFKNYPGRDN